MTQQIVKPPTKRKREEPAGCACDFDHTEDTYRPTYNALQAIIGASKRVQNATDYAAGLRQLVHDLRAVLEPLGIKDTSTPLASLDKRLGSMIEIEADLQAEANKKKPRDKEAGEVHGGRRGLAQEALRQLTGAREKLYVLKQHEEAMARVSAEKKLSKKAAAPSAESVFRRAARALSMPALDAEIADLNRRADEAANAGDLAMARKLRQQRGEYEAVRDEKRRAAS